MKNPFWNVFSLKLRSVRADDLIRGPKRTAPKKKKNTFKYIISESSILSNQHIHIVKTLVNNKAVPPKLDVEEVDANLDFEEDEDIGLPGESDKVGRIPRRVRDAMRNLSLNVSHVGKVNVNYNFGDDSKKKRQAEGEIDNGKAKKRRKNQEIENSEKNEHEKNESSENEKNESSEKKDDKEMKEGNEKKEQEDDIERVIFKFKKKK